MLRRLNWQLHFGEPPKWAAGVKLILVDVEPSARDASKAAVVLQGDASVAVQQLTQALQSQRPDAAAWRARLAEKVSAWCQASMVRVWRSQLGCCRAARRQVSGSAAAESGTSLSSQMLQPGRLSLQTRCMLKCAPNVLSPCE